MLWIVNLAIGLRPGGLRQLTAGPCAKISSPFQGLIIASLVSQIAAGDVYSGRHVIRGSATATPLVQVG